ncbi:cyclic nucleotide-binding domain-containing protein [Rudanella paleaurantiibacter]|uniref:Cyclic nucleotide-binding domain-containing protein n=1 Tax=Rudanella paleaurantiibacter TaxID=2614655 RepID=A0A7J5TZ55_9BACT|nr:Crp/Fnr family transcriptional regulator [Rudanella paleaurantiibacter]KAB7730428.1 cyclic nucleotide-binding domain-containing protein [Rudanella paleaurantiibacter]
MHHPLISYFLKITTLTPHEVDTLIASMEVKQYPKKAFLLKEGQQHTDTLFVLKGCVRQFHIVDGNDITTNFFTEEQWIIAPDTLSTKRPSPYALICMEDTTVVVGNEQKAQALFRQFPKFETTSRQIIEAVLMEQQRLLTSYITDSPEQRYLNVLETRPDLLQRVPQYDIATYIGVKPESLSRIRRKLQTKR